MSQNVTIRLTAEEKAELERLVAAHWEASLASRRAFCAVGAYSQWIAERAFSEFPVPPGYASEYCLMMQTLAPDGTVEALQMWEGIPPDKGLLQWTPNADV
jgi:hypothetical protein